MLTKTYVLSVVSVTVQFEVLRVSVTVPCISHGGQAFNTH